MSCCLYYIGHITKAILCLKFKVSYHALQGDKLYSENGQFIRNSIGFKDQLLCFAVSWQKLMLRLKNKQSFMKTQCKS